MRRIRFDAEKCTGCAACQLACDDQRDILCALNQTPLRHMEQREKNGAIRDYSVGCIHCGKCMQVCPKKAITRNEMGYVVLDEDRCMGCGACKTACPLGVISIHPETGKAMKCDGCWGRIQAGLLPACVHTCPTGALTLPEE